MMPPYIIISPTHGKAEMIRFMTAYLGALWFHGISAVAGMRRAAASSTESIVPLSSSALSFLGQRVYMRVFRSNVSVGLLPILM